tara:strand:+ start:52 stop:720 length:669 start_codon:yes stop_codon:yes gene_type:complete
MFLIVRTKDQIKKTARFFEENKIDHSTFAVSSTELQKIDIPEDVDGFIVTSPNAVLAVPQTKLPFFCVGDATEKECLETGRRVAFTGRADAQDMAKQMAKKFPAMKLVHAAGDMAETKWYSILEDKGIQVVNKTAYQTTYAQNFPEDIKKLLEDEVLRGVIFFSTQGAERFLKLTEQEGINLKEVIAITFSNNISKVCNGFKKVYTTETPSLEDVKNIIMSL